MGPPKSTGGSAWTRRPTAYAPAIASRQAPCLEWATATIVVHSVGIDRFNDPSAGSPTETLLRLLLPLGGRV